MPPQLRRGIGYVIQQTGLFPHRTIEDNIATVPLLIGWAQGRRPATGRGELLELVGLDADDGAADTRTSCPAASSSGSGVARALAADPPVLLMDEPFSAVDPIVRATLQDELLRLQAELHKTIVFVTHDVEEAIKVGDQVAVFFRTAASSPRSITPEHLLGGPGRRLRRGLPRLRPRHPPAGLLPRGRARPRDRAPCSAEDTTIEARPPGRQAAQASRGAGHRRRTAAARLGRRWRELESRDGSDTLGAADAGPLRPHLPGGPGLAARGAGRDRPVAAPGSRSVWTTRAASSGSPPTNGSAPRSRPREEAADREGARTS